MNPLVRRLLGVPKVQALFRRLYRTGPVVWSDLLKDFDIKIEIRGLEHLRELEGQSIVVAANHPHGLLDTFILGHLLNGPGARGDLRFFASDLIGKQFQVLLPSLIPMQTMGRPRPERFRFNQNAMATAVGFLKQPGSTVVTFPGGHASSFKLVSPEGPLRITDSPWKWMPLRLMRETGVRVLPVHISGTNSLWFHVLGAPAVWLRRLFAFHQFMSTRQRTITVTLGPSLGPQDFAGAPEALDDHSLVLRNKVYALSGAPR